MNSGSNSGEKHAQSSGKEDIVIYRCVTKISWYKGVLCCVHVQESYYFRLIELVDYLLQAGHFNNYFFCKDGHYDFYLTGWDWGSEMYASEEFIAVA